MHNGIGDQGCKIISESETFALVQKLLIYPGNGISSDAKKFLHRSKKLRSLLRIKWDSYDIKVNF